VTRVVPVTSGGRLTLRHFSPLQESAPSEGKAGETKDSRPDPKLNKLRFLKVLMPYPLLTPFSDKPILVQSHPCQSLVAKGDSGGPLFLKVTGKGHQVAGIASHNRQFMEPAEPGDMARTWTCQVWQPVQPHLDWIRKAMGGDYGKTLVHTTGQSPLTADEQPKAAETQAESKMESKVARTEGEAGAQQDKAVLADPGLADGT
jgi:hypothetical protein